MDSKTFPRYLGGAWRSLLCAFLVAALGPVARVRSAPPAGVEVKRCTAGYLTDNLRRLAHQLTNYNNVDAYSRVTVEFFQTKGDIKVTEAVLAGVSGALQDLGLDMSKYSFIIKQRAGRYHGRSSCEVAPI